MVINGLMKYKLLDKTQKTYLIVAIAMMLIAAPVFYFTSQRLYRDDADETLMLRKEQFLRTQQNKLKIKDLPTWNAYNSETKLIRTDKILPDSLYFEEIYDSLDEENQAYRVFRTSVMIEQQPCQIFIRMNLMETEDLFSSIVFLFVSLIVMLTLLLFFVTKKISEKLWKPFQDTLSKIEEFEVDKIQPPVFLQTDIEEFDRLNSSFEKLIRKNTQIFISQKAFVENAAHEMQTPLAVFKAKLDELAQSPGLTAEQAGQIEILEKNISRLTRLHKNLLLLSKLESGQYVEKLSIHLSEIIAQQLDFFEEQAKQKNIRIHVDILEETEIMANISLIDILLANLIMNAIRHNHRDGKIFIELKKNQLKISNTGTHTALDSEQLFNRFAKQSGQSEGHGLGLAIVKTIADHYHWNLVYAFEQNFHTFTLRFQP